MTHVNLNGMICSFVIYYPFEAIKKNIIDCMAVCRFVTKKNAFHKTSALVSTTTVPTPQDRALMWTATPGKSANHGSP